MAKIDLPDITPNSDKYREKKAQSIKKVEPVLRPNDIKKDSVIERVAKDFIRNDAKDLKRYFLYDVLFPEIRNILMGTIDSFFKSKGISTRRESSYYGNRSYDSYYRSSSGYSSSYDYGNRNRDRSENRKSDYRDITIRDRGAAEKIIHKMREQIFEYGDASVADLLQFLGLDNDWTDENFGWRNPDDIGLRSVSGGYKIDAREPISLK